MTDVGQVASDLVAPTLPNILVQTKALRSELVYPLRSGDATQQFHMRIHALNAMLLRQS